MVDVQKSFYEYIENISTKTDLRLQYNSWYDYMKDITADNIEKSFYEIEKGLSANGVPPLDAYVVDDGWVDYKSGFWSFNKKFPNQLYDTTQLTSKIISAYGSALAADTAGLIYLRKRWKSVGLVHTMQKQKIFASQIKHTLKM